MAQDDQPEKESGIRNQELGEETAEEKPDFEVKERQTADSEQPSAEKPQIPDVKRPEMPSEENIPAGGPGDQGQTQQTTQTQTNADLTQADADKIEEIKKQLKKPIHTNTSQERKDASEREDKHNKDILSQN